MWSRDGGRPSFCGLTWGCNQRHRPVVFDSKPTPCPCDFLRLPCSSCCGPSPRPSWRSPIVTWNWMPNSGSAPTVRTSSKRPPMPWMLPSSGMSTARSSRRVLTTRWSGTTSWARLFGKCVWSWRRLRAAWLKTASLPQTWCQSASTTTSSIPTWLALKSGLRCAGATG